MVLHSIKKTMKKILSIIVIISFTININAQNKLLEFYLAKVDTVVSKNINGVYSEYLGIGEIKGDKEGGITALYYLEKN